MTPLTDFLPWLRSHLPGCPNALLVDAVRAACGEWCKRTRILSEDRDYSVIAGERVIELVPAVISPGDVMEYHAPWEVLKVTDADDSVLEPANQYDCDNANLDQTTGNPRHYYLDGHDRLVLCPIPDANSTITVKMALRTADDSEVVDDVLFDDHRDAISAGARSWIRRNHGNWLNPSLLAFDQEFFEGAINRYNTRRAQGGVSLPLRSRLFTF